jgi:hypothetical protein
VARPFEAGFEVVDALAEAHRADHPGAALEGVEQAGDAGGWAASSGAVRQLCSGAELVEELAAFVEEDRQQVGVELVAQLGRGRGRPGSGLRAWRPAGAG